MRARDVAVMAFGLFVLASVFGVTLEIANELVGLPLAALLASCAMMGTLKLLNESRVFQEINERSWMRELHRQWAEEDRRMRKVLTKAGLIRASPQRPAPLPPSPPPPEPRPAVPILPLPPETRGRP